MNTRNAMAGQTRLRNGQPPNVQTKQTIAGKIVAVSIHCQLLS